MAKEEYVILVDENDNKIGLKEKMAVHYDGNLHRSFSIIIFNSKDQMLLQKRAATKYHSPSLWTNACCSHQRDGESTINAANRRLMEEMGMKCHMDEIFVFTYQAKLTKGLSEHEVDHCLIGYTDEDPVLNKEEAEDYKWINTSDLLKDIKNNPSSYTYWIKVIVQELVKRRII